MKKCILKFVGEVSFHQKSWYEINSSVKFRRANIFDLVMMKNLILSCIQIFHRTLAYMEKLYVIAKYRLEFLLFIISFRIKDFLVFFRKRLKLSNIQDQKITFINRCFMVMIRCFLIERQKENVKQKAKVVIMIHFIKISVLS